MARLEKALRSPVAVALLLSLVIGLAVVALRASGAFETLELLAYDWQFRLRGRHFEPERRVTLITITESDIQRLGGWPLTDATFAEVLKILLQHRPRAIGLDIYRDIQVGSGQAELNAVLSGNKEVIAAMKVAEGTRPAVLPPAALRGTDQVGFNDILVDGDGIVRRALLFLDDGRTTQYSFALRLALLYLQVEGVTPQSDPATAQHIRLGKRSLVPLEGNEGGYVNADARGYQFLLDYKDSPQPLTSFDLASVLSGRISHDDIADKIVLIGATAESVPDLFHTPLSQGTHGGNIYGVELHAKIAGQFLRMAIDGAPAIVTAGKFYESVWIFLWSLLGSLLGLSVRSPWRFSALLLSGLLALGVICQTMFFFAWWIPAVPPAIALVCAATVVTAYVSNLERRQRAILMQLFSRHVSTEVAEAIWQKRDEFLEAGRLRPQSITVTVLFTDLVSFTTLSEKHEPQAIMAWLNQYMEEMAQQVFRSGGVINQYIGDSIMATFGIPLPRSGDDEVRRDAVNAVKCAVEMRNKLAQLNEGWLGQGLPTARMRIGIFTGPVVVGSLGSKQRLEYTVIGDTVNTASRLESFNKEMFFHNGAGSPCRILVGESTYRCLDGSFLTERVGEVSLSGKQQKVIVYSVVGEAAFPQHERS